MLQYLFIPFYKDKDTNMHGDKKKQPLLERKKKRKKIIIRQDADFGVWKKGLN